MKNRTYLAIALLGLSFIPLFANNSSGSFFSKEEMLIQACNKADLQAVKEILAMGVNINCQDQRGYTPLRIALKKPDIGAKLICELLFAKNPDLNIQDNQGQTILWDHIRNPEATQRLLKLDIDPNILDNDGKSILFYHINNSQIIKKFIEKGANPYVKDKDGCTLLMKTLSKNVFYLLLDHGLDLYAVDNNGKNFFLHSIANYTPEIFPKLGYTDVGISFAELAELTPECNQLRDTNGYNALMYAYQNGLRFVVELLEKRYCLNYQDEQILRMNGCYL